jgi:hypothetical protein
MRRFLINKFGEIYETRSEPEPAPAPLAPAARPVTPITRRVAELAIRTVPGKQAPDMGVVIGVCAFVVAALALAIALFK